jgi:hypothetical protein
LRIRQRLGSHYTILTIKDPNEPSQKRRSSSGHLIGMSFYCFTDPTQDRPSYGGLSALPISLLFSFVDSIWLYVSVDRKKLNGGYVVTAAVTWLAVVAYDLAHH